MMNHHIIKINSKKFRLDLIAFTLSIILTALIYFNTDILNYNHPHFQLPWDHHKYIWMVINNLDFHIAPFCWRVFVPFLALIFPFEISINFKLISLVSIIIAGFFVYKIGLIIFEESVLSISMMICFFSITYAVRFVIYDFWLPDAFAILLITLGIYFILLKSDFAFLIVMIIGALTKETVIFVLPLYYSLQASRIFDKNLLIKTVLISFLPIFVLISIRLFISAYNSNLEYLQTLPYQVKLVHVESSEYNLAHLFKEITIKRIEKINFPFLYKITVYTFMIHFVLALFNFQAIKKWFIRFLPFLFFVYLQIFFAMNVERLVAIGFLPILILSISGLNQVFSKFPFKDFFVLLISFIFYLTSLTSGLFYGNWLIIRQIFFLLLLLVILIVINMFRKHHKRSNATD